MTEFYDFYGVGHWNSHYLVVILPHEKKIKKWLCAQRRLRSAWASTQTVQCLRLHSMGSFKPKLSSCEQRRLRSVWADAQADLSLRWAHRSFCWFCHDAAHFSLTTTYPSLWLYTFSYENPTGRPWPIADRGGPLQLTSNRTWRWESSGDILP